MACELGEGFALLHQSSGTFYILGEIEAFIWRQLSVPGTRDDIVLAVKDAYSGAPEDIEGDVTEFLQSMLEAELFEVNAVEPV
jgi:hypothetical protein